MNRMKRAPRTPPLTETAEPEILPEETENLTMNDLTPNKLHTVTEHTEEQTLKKIREEIQWVDKDNDTQEQNQSQPASQTKNTPSPYHQIKKILYARQGLNGL